MYQDATSYTVKWKSQSNYILVFTLLRISARAVNNEHANNLLCFYIVFFCLRIGRIDRNM